jgi:hypothetical protein
LTSVARLFGYLIHLSRKEIVKLVITNVAGIDATLIVRLVTRRSTVFEQITAPVDLYGTVVKADRNIDISFPSEPRHHRHGSKVGFGIGLLELDRFGHRSNFVQLVNNVISHQVPRA